MYCHSNIIIACLSVLIHLAQTYKVHDAGNEPISNCIILDSEQMTYNGNVTEYVYAATGEKLRVKHTTAVEGLSVPLGQTLELATAQTMDVDKGVTPHLNPYMYCAGNPVKYVDPDGKK